MNISIQACEQEVLLDWYTWKNNIYATLSVQTREYFESICNDCDILEPLKIKFCQLSEESSTYLEELSSSLDLLVQEYIIFNTDI